MEGKEQEALDYIYNKSFLFKKRMGAHTPLHRRIPVCLPPAKLLQSCPTICNPIAHQGPLSMGFSRQENWSQLPCPLPGNLPDPGIESASPSCVSCIGRCILYHSITWEASFLYLLYKILHTLFQSSSPAFSLLPSTPTNTSL